MNREQFFQELRTALHREGFTPQPEQDELLPVEWDGLPLCRITADGGVRYWQEDVATPERERACERATDLACTVREYMTLLEQAPPLQAQSLTGDYRLLADFNGAVLAAHPTRLGTCIVFLKVIALIETCAVKAPVPCDELDAKPGGMGSQHGSIEVSQQAVVIGQALGL